MKKFIGNKKFYRMLLAIVIPIVLQQFITQFVSLIDNLMVGQVGTNEMNGVSLANQLLFVFNLSIFGALSGASIFATQFSGAKNKVGYQETIRFKWLISLLILSVATIILLVFHEQLINSFINSNENDFSDPIITLEKGKNYLLIMMIGNLPFVVKEIYSTSLREMKETFVPMIAGIVAILVNLVFNYLLIFGKFGFKEMGVEGAAIATVISRIVEMSIVLLYTFIKRNKYDYLVGYSKHILKLSSFKKFVPKTALLFSNELLWSLGLTFILKCYALRGLDNIAAFNISNTVTNVFITVGTSLGNATAIILGNYLGSKNVEEAKNSSYKILSFAVMVSIIFAITMSISSYFVPNIYNTSDNIKEIARLLILIGAITLPIQAFNTCCYFTLRAGGKIIITMMFDSLFVWLIRLPLAFILCKFTNLSILAVYGIVMGTELIKSFAGYILVDKGIWLNTIV